MTAKGSALRAENNVTLRADCASCGKSIATEVSIPSSLDHPARRETYGLIGYRGRLRAVFPTCARCHDIGWRPPVSRQIP
jgi:hypothetical protein